MIELLVVIAIIVLLLAILLPAMREARRAGRRAVCQSNLHQMMTAHNTYAADFKGFIGSLNGRTEDYGHYVNGWAPHIAIAAQAREIIDVFTGQTYGSNDLSPFVTVDNTADHPSVAENHAHIPLTDYLSAMIRSPVTVCPEDAPRLSWRQAPTDRAGVAAFMAASPYSLTKSHNVSNAAWQPYSASYQLAPAACAKIGTLTYRQGANHDVYRTKISFGGRRIDEVVFPSMKVSLYDSQQRHYGKTDLFFAFPESRQPLAMFDSSVAVRKTGDANPGWNPADPGAGPTVFRYMPDPAFESPIPDGRNPLLFGYYRWTRGGLAGVDYGGKEVN